MLHSAFNTVEHVSKRSQHSETRSPCAEGNRGISRPIPAGTRFWRPSAAGTAERCMSFGAGIPSAARPDASSGRRPSSSKPRRTSGRAKEVNYELYIVQCQKNLLQAYSKRQTCARTGGTRGAAAGCASTDRSEPEGARLSSTCTTTPATRAARVSHELPISTSCEHSFTAHVRSRAITPKFLGARRGLGRSTVYPASTGLENGHQESRYPKLLPLCAIYRSAVYLKSAMKTVVSCEQPAAE